MELSQLVDDLRERITGINNGLTGDLITRKKTPGKVSDIKMENVKKRENEEASYFLLNMANSLLFSMTHFASDVFDEDRVTGISVPLFCEALTYRVYVQRGIKRSSSTKSSLNRIPSVMTVSIEKVWKKKPSTLLDDSKVMKLGTSRYELQDIEGEFLRRSFFVAASNPLFHCVCSCEFCQN